MITKFVIITVALTASVSFATEKIKSATASVEKADTFKLIKVADLEKLMKDSKDRVFIFDANKDETRVTNGLIPGATPLAKVTDFDAKAVLPANKKAKLVFYCTNTLCMASHEAAKLAVKAGYSDVSVMSDGIQGWKKQASPLRNLKKILNYVLRVKASVR